MKMMIAIGTHRRAIINQSHGPPRPDHAIISHMTVATNKIDIDKQKFQIGLMSLCLKSIYIQPNIIAIKISIIHISLSLITKLIRDKAI
jgi:hypothetical protein